MTFQVLGIVHVEKYKLTDAAAVSGTMGNDERHRQ
jgi:hypothetical protein